MYDDSAGEGTYAYIIDSGIDIDHPDFEGRATFGASFVSNEAETDKSKYQQPLCPAGLPSWLLMGNADGHGTHVAGTTGSVSYGVAKKTNLIAVKVLNAEGSGKLSDVIAGIQWAVDDARSKDRKSPRFHFRSVSQA